MTTPKTSPPLSKAAQRACTRYVARAWRRMGLKRTTRHGAFGGAVRDVQRQLITKLTDLGIDPETVTHDVVMSLLSGGVVVE